MSLRVLGISVLGITLLSLLPFSAFGQEKRHYLTAKAGIYTPTGDLDNSNFDTGFNGEIGWGYYVLSNVTLEVGAGFFNTDDIRVIPLMVTGKAVYPMERWELFALAGAGAYFANFDGVLTDTVLGSVSVDDDDTVFGLTLGFGANYNITDEIFLGIEGKYLLTTDAEFGGNALGGPAKVETDLNGVIITATFGFRF